MRPSGCSWQSRYNYSINNVTMTTSTDDRQPARLTDTDHKANRWVTPARSACVLVTDQWAHTDQYSSSCAARVGRYANYTAGCRCICIAQIAPAAKQQLHDISARTQLHGVSAIHSGVSILLQAQNNRLHRLENNGYCKMGHLWEERQRSWLITSNFVPWSLRNYLHKKLCYRRVTTRCVLSVVILPIATQQCRNYLYDKSWPYWWYEVGGLVGGDVSWTMCTQPWRDRVGSHCLRCHKQTDDGRVVYITCIPTTCCGEIF